MGLDPLYLDSIGSLREIRGIGEKIADRLENFFGSEEEALERVREGDVAGLSRAPGLTEAKASRIVRNAIAEEYGADEFHQTEVAMEICERILEKVRDKACTAYGKAKLNIYFPTSSEDRIREVREMVRKAINVEVDDGIEESLKHVSPLSDPDKIWIGDRAAVTADPEELEEAGKVFSDVLPVELAKSRRELEEIARDHELIILADDALSGWDDASQSIEHKPNALEEPIEVIPEKILSFFAENREAIRNSINVWKGISASTCDLFDDVDGEKIRRLESLLSRLDSGGGVRGNEELKRLDGALRELDGAISDAELEVNEEIERIFEEKEIRIGGADLLDLVKQDGEVKDLIRSDLENDFDRVVEEAINDLISCLGLDFEERDLAWDLFSKDLEFPVEVDEGAVERLRKRLRREYSRESLNVKVELARELKDFEGDVRNLVENVLELDVALSVKRFAREHGMTLPKLGGDGFRIRKGRNLLLQDPEPIDYQAGEVTLLTGVNSGGKTSTLDLIAQVYTLAQMGFPVPAEEVRVEPVDKIYYYRPARRTMNSGAFEGALREFEKLLESDGSKLVLVDELENITEPGASARIISGILEILKGEDITAVFVSHLAEKIKEEANYDIRVDGIEAEGLDGEMNLIVDRTPKKGLLATSTPELIVKKLSNRSNSEFYDKLIEKFG